MLTRSQIDAVLAYAETVIAVNPAAEHDIELLLERLDDEFNIEQMGGDYISVCDAVSRKFFGEPYEATYQPTVIKPA